VSSTALILTDIHSLEPAINRYLNGATRNYRRRVNNVLYVSSKTRRAALRGIAMKF
jgi:hypothetical protein